MALKTGKSLRINKYRYMYLQLQRQILEDGKSGISVQNQNNEYFLWNLKNFYENGRLVMSACMFAWLQFFLISHTSRLRGDLFEKFAIHLAHSLAEHIQSFSLHNFIASGWRCGNFFNSHE